MPSRSQPDGGAVLSDYVVAVRRRWWLVVLGVVTGLIVAAAYLLIAPKTYTSVAKVLVTDTGVADSSVPAGARINTPNVDMDTEAQIVKSNAVATLVATTLHSTASPSSLAADVTVTVPPNSTVLNISFHGGSAASARAGAQVFAESYLNNRKTIAQGLLNGQMQTLQQQLAPLNNQLVALTAQAANSPAGSQQAAYATLEENIVRAQIDSINASITTLQQQQVTPGELVSPATLPTTPSFPQRKLLLLDGGLAGLLLGAAFALGAFRRDRRIRRKRAAIEHLDLPLLADLSAASGADGPELSPDELAGAAGGRELRDRLIGNGLARCVLVVPLSSPRGGSLVARTLAASLAAGGAPCVLVCASPDSITASQPGIGAAAGLSDVLAAPGRPLQAAVVQDAALPYAVVPPGQRRKELLDQFHGTAFTEFLRGLRAAYDQVVIEAPDWVLSRSALVIGQATQGVILVADATLTSRDMAREAAEMFDDAGVKVLGVVLSPSALSGPSRAAEAAPAAGAATERQEAPTSPAR